MAGTGRSGETRRDRDGEVFGRAEVSEKGRSVTAFYSDERLNGEIESERVRGSRRSGRRKCQKCENMLISLAGR